MNCRINRPVLDLDSYRVFTKEVVAFPIPGRPDWPWSETATAIRTDVYHDRVDAGRAERALIAANARFERIGRQCLVAVFARRSEFKHSAPL